MRNRHSSMTYAGLLPNSSWVHRVSRGLLIMAAITLFAMSKTGNPVATKLRTTLLDTLTPFIAVAASPFDAIANATAWMESMVAMRAENIALKNENLQLLQWQSIAKRTEAENLSLKKLMKVVPGSKYNYVSVSIVSDISGPYARSALVNGGLIHGIKIDQPIINHDGLIGRVVEAGKTSARVLLLGDINSRVPVMAERTRAKSILAGTNTGEPVLSYLPANTQLQIGDRVVTSGDGGVFPGGIPVGVVSSVSGDTVKVQPFADLSHVEYVSAIDYAF